LTAVLHWSRSKKFYGLWCHTGGGHIFPIPELPGFHQKKYRGPLVSGPDKVQDSHQGSGHNRPQSPDAHLQNSDKEFGFFLYPPFPGLP
jgi:hypothetical protein